MIIEELLSNIYEQLNDTVYKHNLNHQEKLPSKMNNFSLLIK